MSSSEFTAKVDFAVFPNDHKKPGDKTPDHRGQVTISKTLLKEMVGLVKADEEVILQVALWDNESKKSKKKYLHGRLSVDTYNVNKNRDKNGRKPETKETGTEAEEDFDNEDLFG